MDKTAVVSILRVIVHPVYGKRVKRFKKYQVHDEENKAVAGQIARFVASRPYSKTKKWKLIELLDSKNIEEAKVEKTEKRIKAKSKSKALGSVKGGKKR